VDVLIRNGGTNSTSATVLFSAGGTNSASISDTIEGQFAELDPIAISDPGSGPALLPAGQRIHWHVRAAMDKLGAGCFYSAIATRVTG
jgi:hypothetical protein